jgi:hypothetical protein
MHKKYNFVFITTNLINGKQYIGDHSTNNLDDNYLGSGIYIHNAILKYGKENFKIQILEFFDTRKEAFNAQEKHIKKCNTLIPKGYNVSPKGGHQTNGGFNAKSRKKLSNTRKKKGLAKGEKNPMYGKSVYSVWLLKYGKEKADILQEQKIQKHKKYKHTEISKDKIRKTIKKIRSTTNPIWNKGKTKETNEIVRKSAMTRSKTLEGRKLAEEHKKHKKEAQNKTPQILCVYCGKLCDNKSGYYTKYHGEKCKFKEN